MSEKVIEFLGGLIQTYGLFVVVAIAFGAVFLYLIYTQIGRVTEHIIRVRENKRDQEFEELKQNYEALRDASIKLRTTLKQYKIFDYDEIKNHDLFIQYNRFMTTTLPHLRNFVKNEANRNFIDYMEVFIKTAHETYLIFTYNNEVAMMNQYELKDHLENLRKKLETKTRDLFISQGKTKVDLEEIRKSHYDLTLFRQYLSDFILTRTDNVNSSIKLWVYLSIERFYIVSLIDKINTMK